MKHEPIVARIHYHEYDHAFEDPLLILELPSGESVGYDMDDNGVVGDLACICNAWNKSECVCRYNWD